MTKKILTFDIETIINTESASNFLRIDNKTDQDLIVEKLTEYHINATKAQNPFFRQPFWKVVCISYVESEEIESNESGKFFNVKNIRSAKEVNSLEKDLIFSFFEYCAKNNPRIVTFNGKTFDIPVLKYRAMYYEIQLKWFYAEEVISQYKTEKKYNDKWGDKYNLDLIDFYKSPGGSVKMEEVCAAFGVPCKYEAHGSDVYDLYKRSEIETIRNYCETDAISTYILYIIYEYHIGSINYNGYKKSMTNLFEFMKSKELKHFDEFIVNSAGILAKFTNDKNGDSFLL